jgi:hypothetical protein
MMVVARLLIFIDATVSRNNRATINTPNPEYCDNRLEPKTTANSCSIENV